ncbi:eukaryotic translation initiation factor 3 subunit C-like [Zophobas morio]|uniref:eukaryotic translation initiation factor 3 subunit C-like n=1 Tax=Zophobas morio TaxID=2755281 RepID=UPI0030839E46
MNEYRKEPYEEDEEDELDYNESNLKDDENEKGDDPEFKKTRNKKVAINLTAVLEKKPLEIFPKGTKITAQVVLAKLRELARQRGKKLTIFVEVMDQLNQLKKIISEHQLGSGLEVKLTCLLILYRSDNFVRGTNYIAASEWLEVVQDVERLLTFTDSVNIYPRLTEEEEVVELTSEQQTYKVNGDILSYIEKLDDLLIRHLQAADPHTTEYVALLKNENVLYKLLLDSRTFVESFHNENYNCRLYSLLLSHVYYKKLNILKKVDELIGVPHDPEFLKKLCNYLYAHSSIGPLRARAILCHIYFLSLHDHWQEARDLLLMSHLQDSIHLADVDTQILYNRVLAQLGLCAFRCGKIVEAHSCLYDLTSSGRAKDLLAQGFTNQRHSMRTPEQQAAEKSRQVPFHLHINLELVECVCLSCAMLLEIPNIAANPYDNKRRVISKQFRRLLEHNNRLPFSGPPENTREHIVAAAKCLSHGNWKGACDLLFNIKVWPLLASLDKVKEILEAKVKEEGLKTYLFTYGPMYDSLRLDELSGMFELNSKHVRNLVTRLMIRGELRASWDQERDCIVMHKNEPTRLQHLAKQLADKGAVLVENNERFLDMLTGVYGYRDNIRGRVGPHDSQVTRRYPLRGEGHGGRGARGIQGSSVGGGRGGRGWAWGKGGGLDAPVESFSGGGRFDSRFMQNKSTLAGQL